MNISPLKTITNSKIVNRHINRVLRDDSYAAKALVTSNVLKDAWVYALRYQKSKNNEEIPEDKRSFVAALDAACGITTCITQLALGYSIANKKLQDGLCNRLFSNLKKSSPGIFKKAKKGFIAATSLLVSGVIGERVIVPLVATPLASRIKDKHLGRDNNKLPFNASTNINELYEKIKAGIYSK